MLKKIKKYLPHILVIILFLALYTPIIYNLKHAGDEALEGRSGGGGEVTTGSILENTTGSYSDYLLVDGPLYLHRIVIGDSISGAGGILYNATTNNANAIQQLAFTAAPVGSIEIGAYLNMGLLITTSPTLDVGFVVTPL